MADDNWSEVRRLIHGKNIELGPYFGHQIQDSPRHALFTLARYKFAARMLPQDRLVRVLEVGCSEGIGTLMLAERGHDVLGIDADAEAVAHANKVLKKPNVRFESRDFIGQRIGEFDALVSLDVIEHIDGASEVAFMESIRANLTPEGMCIIGTPNDSASRYASQASQIGHVNMFTAERLTELMRRHFVHVFLFGMNDEVVHSGFYPMCHYLIALACTPRQA